jgi:hypothetical protein
MSRFAFALLLASLLPMGTLAYEPGEQAPAASQFTFAWPLDEHALKPRGATTRGTPVILDAAPSESWKRLREAGLSDHERDRRAILAMAGPYRVTFDFLEVVRFDPSLKPDAPYQSWGTEYVFVSEDRKDFIALQHILVQRVRMEDGTVSEPIVVRHWRQEWRYQPDSIVVYEGANTWSRRALAEEQRRGAWAQSVFQVDDSPRYAAIGRWQHNDGGSTWIGDETWRPLPRREFSVRKDYQVLVGTNRHTITPTGWVQEENNLKLALDRNGKPRAEQSYFERTEPFWAEVRAAWRELEQREPRFTLRAPVDQGKLFIAFFEYADDLAEGKPFDRKEARALVDKTLRETYLTVEGAGRS